MDEIKGSWKFQPQKVFVHPDRSITLLLSLLSTCSLLSSCSSLSGGPRAGVHARGEVRAYPEANRKRGDPSAVCEGRCHAHLKRGEIRKNKQNTRHTKEEIHDNSKKQVHAWEDLTSAGCCHECLQEVRSSFADMYCLQCIQFVGCAAWRLNRHPSHCCVFWLVSLS